MQEVFRSIKGYEELYEVSNLGRVKSLGNGKSAQSKKRILALCKSKKGYLRIKLYQNGKRKSCQVSRLMALTFLPNPNNLSEVNHKNSIKTDNRVENLEWCDQRYNRNHFHQTQKTSSKYPGVCWHKMAGKWTVNISVNTRQKHLGCFDDELEAAAVYQRTVEELENVA